MIPLRFIRETKKRLLLLAAKHKVYVGSFVAAVFFLLGLVTGIYLFSETPLTKPERTVYFVLAIGGLLGLPFIVMKKIYELEIAERQLALADSKIKHEALDTNTVSNEVANFLKDRFSAELDWLDRAYEARSNHYRIEKGILAKAIVGALKERVKHVEKRNKGKIRVILDSGTTISPIFHELGRQAVLEGGSWISKLEIYTNNVRGLQIFFSCKKETDDAAKTDPQADRYRDIAVTCKVLPGSTLSAYQAIADESTVERVLGLKNDGCYIIGITTGNYILFDDEKDASLPIAKIGYHPHIKAAIFHVADEVYLVAPLGKILRTEEGDNRFHNTLTNLNNDLGHNAPITANAALRPYTLVEPALLKELNYRKIKYKGDRWSAKTILFTTSRKDGRLLAHHANRLSRLRPYDPASTELSGSNTRGYILSEDFEEYPVVSTEEEREMEIPHKYLHQLTKKYFWLS